MEGRVLQKHTDICWDLNHWQDAGFHSFAALPVLSVTAALSLLEQLCLEAVTPMAYTWLHARPSNRHVVSLEEHSKRWPALSVAEA